jgi:myo-inositol-1(or 4)-monophosphatase
VDEAERLDGVHGARMLPVFQRFSLPGRPPSGLVYSPPVSRRPPSRPARDELVALAERAATAAGELLLERFRGPARGVAVKSTATDMVSDADRDAEARIVEILAAARPGDAVLAEEGGAAGTGSLRWVIDPLDGTTNYLYGVPAWTVSIACEDEDGGLAGVVHDPAAGETFVAVRGAGATLNGRPIRASAATDLRRALVATGFSYREEERRVQAAALPAILPRVRDLRRDGSAARDLAWVACGRVDGYYEVPTMHWDRAAGVLLVAEAGGRTTPLAPIGPSGDGALAAAAGVHDALLALVRAALAAAGAALRPENPIHS